MKRFIVLCILLMAVSLACQTAQRVLVPSPAASEASPTSIQCTDDACLDACLARINRKLTSLPQEDVGGNYAGADAKFNLVSYTVNGDQIGEADILWVPSEYEIYQQDSATHEHVWNYFTSLIPAEQRKWITKYTIFTDGTLETLAWVSMEEYGDNSRWELGVDVLDSADLLRLTQTITHELGHLLTLNSDQIIQSDGFAYTPHQNTAVCAQFLSTEGCSTPVSYINQFYQKYWLDIYEDWLEIVYKANAKNNEELREVVSQFHAKHAAEFARVYAATNIKEDLAVSFERFILGPKPSGNGIVDQKVLFFYDFPELVILRQQMIQGLCTIN